jgi:dipeptidyl-peptidase 4
MPSLFHYAQYYFASAFLFGCSLLHAQAPALTTDWVAHAGGRVADAPTTLWLENNTAILADHDLSTAQRGFVLLDPRSGNRKQLGNMSAMVASLRTLDPGVNLPENVLPWPEAFNSLGTQALYIESGDLFLLDLESSSFNRLTKTTAEEKDPQFSPDGRFISFVRDNDIYVYDLNVHKETQLTHDGSVTTLNGTLSWVYWEEVFGRRDTAIWWSPDSRSIAYFQTDESGVPVSTFVDFSPVHQRLIRQPYPKPGDHNPGIRVGVVSPFGGDTRWVSILDKPYEWILRAQWLPDSKRISIETLDRNQTALGLYLAGIADGKAKRILTETDPQWVNVNDDLYFLKKNEFLWASERDGFMHLYRYTLDGTLINQVTKGKWAIASSHGGAFWVHQGVVGIDEQKRQIYFTALKESSIERQLYRINYNGSELTKISTEHGTHAINMSRDAEFYFDTYSSIHTLPTLRLHSADGSLKATIMPPHSELLPAAMQFPQLTTVPAADGFPMPTQILKPQDFDPTHRYPVILHIYGGPSAPTVTDSWQDQTLFDNIMASKGYVMIAIDNRAATSISKLLENTLATNLEGAVADLLAGVQWLKQQPWVDGSRVGVWGWSGGGNNTLNLMTRSTEFKAGIAGAPVTDWRYYDSKWGEAFLKLPKDNPSGYDEMSVIPRALNLHGTLLLIYGTDDDNVHPQNEEALMNALIAAGISYQVELFPMRKHDFVDEPAILARYNSMMAFWLANL